MVAGVRAGNDVAIRALLHRLAGGASTVVRPLRAPAQRGPAPLTAADGWTYT